MSRSGHRRKRGPESGANERAWRQQTWGIVLIALFLFLFLMVRYWRFINWRMR